MPLSQCEIAKSIAFKAHEEQFDKAGRPYIEHPTHVAPSVKGEEAKAVAWLHDVVEDTSLTFDDLAAMGIKDAVIDALQLLTHDETVSYFDYVRELKQNPLAKMVKQADLEHNSDLSRLENVTEEDKRRAEKYRQAMQILSE